MLTANSGSGRPLQPLQLRADAQAAPALTSHVRPGLVLYESEARELLQQARALDVGNGGRFAAGPAGIQVWNGPFDGLGGTRGTAIHLGSVDWVYDTPARNYATIYRVFVTVAGADLGETTRSVLTAVLDLAGVPIDRASLTMAAAPGRDPFHRRA